MPTVYVTAPPEAGQDIARTLVEERLAACVNRLDCDSVYRWQGSVETGAEEILLIKTTDDAYDRLVERIEALHPYDVPCIERFDESAAPPAFETWIENSVD